MRKLLLAAFLLFAPPALAQGPGPGPTPNPWFVNGNNISYPGGVVVGTPTGTANSGDINISGAFRVNGVSIASLPCTFCALTNTPNNFSAAQVINLNSTVLQAGQTGTALQIGQANGIANRIELDSYAAAARFTCVRADNTNAAPSALQAGDEACSINMFGYSGTTYTGPQAAIRMYAAANWGTVTGTYIDFATTASSDTSRTLTSRMHVENDGGVTLNGGTSLGLGTISSTVNAASEASWRFANTSTGTTAAAYLDVSNGTGLALVGIGGVNYTTITALQNRAFLLSSAAASGVTVYSTGANPIDFYVNGSRAGGFTSTGMLTVSANTTIAPTPSAGTLFQLTGQDGASARVTMNGFGNTGSSLPAFLTSRSRGTNATPTAVQSGDALTSWVSNGYGTTGYSGFGAILQINACQNWTDAAQCTNFEFDTTATGASAPTNTLLIQSGILLPKTVTGGDQGNGTINVAGNYFVNGVAYAAFTKTLTNTTYDTAGTGNSFLINGLAVTANTGTGAVVRASGSSLITPNLGAATGTSLALGGCTIGANVECLTGSLAVSVNVSANTFNNIALTALGTTGTIAIGSGKTFTSSNTLTLAGTDSTTMTFPTTSATMARTDAAQTFTGTQTFSSTIAGSISGNAATVPSSGLTGTTLASNVLASSLTSLGTIANLTATNIGAFTLAGTISGGGNNINNVNVGVITPGTGAFTTASVSSSFSAAIDYGGSAAGSTKLINGTSSGSPASAFLNLQSNGQFVSIGNPAPKTYLDVNENAASSPALVVSTSLARMQAANNVSGGFEMVSYETAGTLGNILTGAVAGGTAASPSGTVSGAYMFNMRGYGYTGSAWATGGIWIITPSEAWSSGHQGTSQQWYTTPTGTATITQAMVLNASGGLSVGSTADAGAGSIFANTLVDSPIYASPSVMTFENNGGVIAGHIDTGQHWIMGTNVAAGATNPANLTLTNNVSNTVAPISGTLLQLVNVDNLRTELALDAYGVSGGAAVPAGLSVRVARGSQAAPTALQVGDPLFSFIANGYGTTGFSGFAALINASAAENFTDTAQGTNWTFYTNTIGATSPILRLQIQAGVSVGTTTDPGVGKISALNGYVAGGVAGLTCSGTPTASFASTSGIVTHC